MLSGRQFGFEIPIEYTTKYAILHSRHVHNLISHFVFIGSYVNFSIYEQAQTLNSKSNCSPHKINRISLSLTFDLIVIMDLLFVT